MKDPVATDSSVRLLVDQARTGDLAAFTLLVAEFQSAAYTSAYSWLADADLARDATQEAFLDAYLQLQHLQEPAAFPGWLRKIVVKHCDRQTRRRQLPTMEVDPDETISAAGSPLSAAIAAEEEAHIRRAVEQLPEKLRLIVALHYFGGVSGPSIAAFLELPLTTVKKRLRSARQQLRKEEPMMTRRQNLHTQRQDFPDEIAMFIALRAGNIDHVRKLVHKSPELLRAEQNWSRDLVYDGVLPFAKRATPLIVAIESGDVAMLQLLIEAGADVNGLCGCETGEPPLWTAVLLQREQHVALLLEAGADPNVRSASGNTALHIAAMRGYIAIVRRLLEYGADRTLTDEPSGAIWPLTAGAADKPAWKPVDWARRNGHDDVARLLDDVSAPRSMPSNHFRTGANLIHTGIKALDFFTPMHKGSLTRIPFKAGVGMMVLLGELSQGFLSQPTGAVVWTGFTQPPFDLPDLDAELFEFGLRDGVRVALASYLQPESQQRDTFREGIALLERLRNAGRDVLAVIQSVEGFETDIEETLMRLTANSNQGSITTLVLSPFRDAEQSWDQLQAPYVNQISLDRRRAVLNMYPAFDPCKSLTDVSALHNGDGHQKLLDSVRDVFRVEELRNPEFLAGDDSQRDPRVRQLTSYFMQSFRITEPFRGTPGESVSRDRLLDDIAGIMEGESVTGLT